MKVTLELTKANRVLVRWERRDYPLVLTPNELNALLTNAAQIKQFLEQNFKKKSHG